MKIVQISYFSLFIEFDREKQSRFLISLTLISRNVTTPAASRMRFSISRLRNRVNSLLKLDNTHSCVYEK